MNKVWKVLLEALPVLFMLVLIYIVQDDYLLAGIYLLVITAAFLVRYERLDFTALILGIVIMTVGETLFISTGIETFKRQSLFGMMPIWLPILWGYGFVAIKRSAKILR